MPCPVSPSSPLPSSPPYRDLPSFPTRRSSDLPSCRRVGLPRSQSHGPKPTPTKFRSSCTGHWRHLATPLPRSGGANDQCNRSEEHTSELQSRGHLVCRLLLEKKNKKKKARRIS